MGEDVRELPFKERKAFLAKNRAAMPAGKDRTVHRRRSPAVQRRMQARPRGHSSEKDGKTLRPGETTWFKILNPTYSQKEGRGELFEKRAG